MLNRKCWKINLLSKLEVPSILSKYKFTRMIIKYGHPYSSYCEANMVPGTRMKIANNNLCDCEQIIIHVCFNPVVQEWRLSISTLGICVFCPFFLFLSRTIWLFNHFSATQVGPIYCSRDPQTSLFNNFFIKIGSHGI